MQIITDGLSLFPLISQMDADFLISYFLLLASYSSLLSHSAFNIVLCMSVFTRSLSFAVLRPKSKL